MFWRKKPKPYPLHDFCAKVNEHNPCPTWFIDDHIALCTEIYHSLPSPTQRHAEALGRALCPIINQLNESACLYTTIWGELVEAMVYHLTQSNLYGSLMSKLDANLEGKPLPSEADYMRPYLKDTPLERLCSVPIPLYVPPNILLEHTHILGGTGAGKTSFLAQLILCLIKRDCSIVVVDSQNSLVPRLRTLKKIQERIVYIDPRNPPSIDLFTKGASETFDYLFDSLVGADLTGKQSVFFDMLTRLMLTIPNATLRDMIELTADIRPYQEHINRLPDIARTFFERDFTSQTFKQTREQVRYRLNALLADENMARLFTGGSIDFGLDRGSVVLINSDRDYLGRNSGAFGRLFIFLVLRELFSRNPNSKNKPVYLIVDEAHEAFDRNVDILLTQARKYGCGAVLAHQTLAQASPDLRASLASNTSIKLASGVSSADAKAIATDMRTTPDFILSQKPLNFACYVRTVTDRAVSIPVIPSQLDDEEHVHLRKHEPKSEPKRDIPEPIGDKASDTW